MGHLVRPDAGRRPSLLGLACIGIALLSAVTASASPDPRPDPRIVPRVMALTRATVWQPVAAIQIPFKTFHPQGMVKIGDDFYVSSVEVRTLPKKLTVPDGRHDRDTGSGVGHLFKIASDGRLLADIVLGEGPIYHPGGIDFDGNSIWVPVSEYRPDSRAIVYRIDPGTMKATEAFRFDDHLGGIVHDVDAGQLRGISWGSRRFYAWPMGADRRPASAGAARPVANPDQYIDYQDCHYVGARKMLCAGLGDYRAAPDAPVFQLGGMDLVDLARDQPIWQVPIALRSPSGRSMTQNPFFVEATAAGLRAYFMPDDDRSTLYVFDAVPPTPAK